MSPRNGEPRHATMGKLVLSLHWQVWKHRNSTATASPSSIPLCPFGHVHQFCALLDHDHFLTDAPSPKLHLQSSPSTHDSYITQDSKTQMPACNPFVCPRMSKIVLKSHFTPAPWNYQSAPSLRFFVAAGTVG